MTSDYKEQCFRRPLSRHRLPIIGIRLSVSTVLVFYWKRRVFPVTELLNLAKFMVFPMISTAAYGARIPSLQIFVRGLGTLSRLSEFSIFSLPLCLKPTLPFPICDATNKRKEGR